LGRLWQATFRQIEYIPGVKVVLLACYHILFGEVVEGCESKKKAQVVCLNELSQFLINLEGILRPKIEPTT
jgi:hypothetical protein